MKDVSSPEELGILAALCPSLAEDIFYAAWFSGYKYSGYFNDGKIFTALHDFCARDPDAAVIILDLAKRISDTYDRLAHKSRKEDL